MLTRVREALIQGRKLAYREQGQGGVPLLCVHGAGGSSLHFRELISALAGHFRVVALDLPGHGRSEDFALDDAGERLKPERLIQTYAEVAAVFAEQIGLGKFCLAGHSMGGAIAQEFAARFGDRLERLILIGTAGRLKVDPSILVAIESYFDQLPRLLASVCYSPETSAAETRRLADEQVQAEQGVMLRDFQACAAFDQRAQLAEIRLPALVVAGADDRLTPAAVQRQLAERLGDGRLVLIPGAGHFVQRERAEKVAAAILSDQRSKPSAQCS
jgi:pimeloyl-ACP methyl ester carboxylesterase